MVELDRHAFAHHLIRVVHRPLRLWRYASINARHWSRAYDACRVCSIDWDFIGKFETIENDSEHVMAEIGLKGRVSLGLHQKSNGFEKVFEYYKGLPRQVLADFYHAYEPDFQVLGYSIPAELTSTLASDHPQDLLFPINTPKK